MSSLDKTVLVAIIGASGRMGHFADRWISGQANVKVVDRVHSGDDLSQVLAASQAHVALDFTRAGLGAQHANLILEAGLRPVIGTSGVDPKEDEALDLLARKQGLGGLIVPNFSLGVCLQQKLSLLAAKTMGVVEIVEEHHRRKVDKPSATALDTAQRILEVLPPGSASVPIHSIRTLGVHSNQTVICTGPGEVLRIVHETYGLEAFGPGISLAIGHVMGQSGMHRGLQHCL